MTDSQDRTAPWPLQGERDLHATPIFTLRERTARSPTRPDVVGSFVYLDSPDWINVLAITPEGTVVFVEQFRHGTRTVTLEIPGGMVDPGEDFATAGVRELREETGYVGDAPVLIGVVEPNPAIQSNRCGTVLIPNARPLARQETDTHEEIRVVLHPERALGDLVRSGAITHALVVAAFHHLALWRSAPEP